MSQHRLIGGSSLHTCIPHARLLRHLMSISITLGQFIATATRIPKAHVVGELPRHGSLLMLAAFRTGSQRGPHHPLQLIYMYLQTCHTITAAF